MYVFRSWGSYHQISRYKRNQIKNYTLASWFLLGRIPTAAVLLWLVSCWMRVSSADYPEPHRLFHFPPYVLPLYSHWAQFWLFPQLEVLLHCVHWAPRGPFPNYHWISFGLTELFWPYSRLASSLDATTQLWMKLYCSSPPLLNSFTVRLGSEKALWRVKQPLSALPLLLRCKPKIGPSLLLLRRSSGNEWRGFSMGWRSLAKGWVCVWNTDLLSEEWMKT